MPTDPSAADELLSSYLDGEATPEEAVPIDTEPGLSGRLAELRAAKELVATPVAPLRSEAVDRVVAAALAASDPAAGVADLTEARARLRPRIRTGVAVAAGVLALAAAVPLLRALDRDDSRELADADATTADTDADASDIGDDASAGADGDLELQAEALPPVSAGSDAVDDSAFAGDDSFDEDLAAAEIETGGGASATGATLADVDAVADLEALAAILGERLTTLPRAALPCLAEFQAFAAGGPFVVLDHAVVEVGGVPTAVVVLQSPEAPAALLAASVRTCAPVTEIELGE